MINANQPVRVLAICDPGATQDQIQTALANQAEFQLVKFLNSLDKLSKEVHAAEPGLIVIGHQVGGQPTIDVIDDVAMQFPEVPLVAVLPEGDPLRAQQATLAGARAFVTEPFTQASLLSTLRRVRDLEARRTKYQGVAPGKAEEGAQPLRTFAVYSPRGGTGVSTLAASLAAEMHEETAARVLLVDGKLFFGHLDLMLNIRSKNNIADLVPHAAALDSGLIGDVVVEHASGMHVLMSPPDVQVAQGFRPEDLYNILTGLRRAFEFVVIDAGSALNENTVTMLDAADRILLVTTPDLAALHDASRFIQVSRSLSYPAEKILVVLNRANQIGGVRVRDIEAALKRELFAQVPDDSANALRSINRGIPLAIKYPRSPASQALRKLAKALVLMGTPQPSRKAAKASKVPARKPAKQAAGKRATVATAQRTKT
jgi:pilus assembly protein CpaE